MRKIVTSLFFMAALVPVSLHAQEAAKLTLPASPAFSILDYEPAAVMRPANAKAFASDILNSFDKDGKLVMNLGLEVAPYWLGSHSKLTRKTYLNPSFGQLLAQSVSLSAATVKDSASGDNRLSSGIRFKLANGRYLKELDTASALLKTKTTVITILAGYQAVAGTPPLDTKQKVIDAIEAALVEQGIPKEIVTGLKKDAVKSAAAYPESREGSRAFLRDLVASRAEAYQELAKKISDLLYKRKGLVLEMAAASGFNTTKNNSLEKVGFWLNASYLVSSDDFLTFTARHMIKNRDSVVRNTDAGVGFLKKTAGFNVSVEAMLRHYTAEIKDLNASNQPITRIEKELTWRMAVQGSFKVSEDINLNLSFGKDFKSPFISRSGVFSIFGLNYSLFKKDLDKLKEE